MRQVEMVRTIVLDAPRQARALFEALVADNIGIGRPAVVSVLFERRVQRNTQSIFRTRVFTEGTQVRIDFIYKHCRVKLYLKEERALRIETVVNDPGDLDILKGLVHLPKVQRVARQINARVLTMLCVGQSCAIETALFERVSQPYVREGQRTGALRFGDARVMVLAGALCLTVHAVAGFNNRSLRALVAGLLGATYTQSRMTYDLRRLRLDGLIRRLPRSNTYVLTPEGIRVAFFYTNVHDRLLRPLLAADQPPAPLTLRHALHVIDQSVDSLHRPCTPTISCLKNLSHRHGSGLPRSPSGSLTTVLAKVTDNPVNLRGSPKPLPQEGRCELNQERSASSIDQFGAKRSGAVSAQPECTSGISCASASVPRGQRRQLVHRSSATRRACRGRFDHHRCCTAQPSANGF